MRHLNHVLLPLFLESSTPKPSTIGTSREERTWPEEEDCSMSPFIQGASIPCPGPSLKQDGPQVKRASSSLLPAASVSGENPSRFILSH